MIESDILKAIGPIAAAFERLGVRWHIGGSVVSSIHGVPRSTLDVDLVADMKPGHAPGLVEALQDSYYVDESMVQDAIARRASFNVIHLETMLKIDVFVLKTRDYDLEAFGRMQEKELERGEKYFVASPEDTILNKLEWYRIGNEISERQWKDVVGVIRVQGGTLDRPYLKTWAAVLKLDDLLARAFDHAGATL